jgi:hypothetical protein
MQPATNLFYIAIGYNERINNNYFWFDLFSSDIEVGTKIIKAIR